MSLPTPRFPLATEHLPYATAIGTVTWRYEEVTLYLRLIVGCYLKLNLKQTMAITANLQVKAICELISSIAPDDTEADVVVKSMQSARERRNRVVHSLYAVDHEQKLHTHKFSAWGTLKRDSKPARLEDIQALGDDLAIILISARLLRERLARETET